MSGCQKDIQPVDVPVDVGEPEGKSTSDFRSAFTGNFLVNYYKKSSYMNTTQDSVNATYTLHVDYSLNDSVFYNNYYVHFSFPKISFFLNNAFLIGFGIEPNGEATLKSFDPMAAADILSQSGGFITADSINYTYSVSNPKTPRLVKIVGHRVP
jgi:hypothetical protein